MHHSLWNPFSHTSVRMIIRLLCYCIFFVIIIDYVLLNLFRSIQPLINTSNFLKGWVWAKAGVRSQGINSVHLCGYETPNHLNQHGCLPGSTLAGSRSQELQLAIGPRLKLQYLILQFPHHISSKPDDSSQHLLHSE